MKMIKKFFNFIKILTVGSISKWKYSTDAIEYFVNKSVVIIGPTSSLDKKLITKIRNADICILINKGHRLKSFDLIKKTAKKIILFHCLDQSEQTGGGKINTWELRLKGFKEIIYPLNDDKFQENVNFFHKNNIGFLKLIQVDKFFYNNIKNAIEGFTPNTGSAAIYVTSSASNAKVYVHGISFYRTAYLEEYAPHLENISDAIKLIETYSNHNPDLEFIYFKSLILNRNIEVCDELRKIIDQPYIPYFYNIKKDNNVQ